MVDFGQVSADAWVQVVALLLTTGVAIGGAFFGARLGADATRAATQDAIAADRAAGAARRDAEERDALYALAAECRLNARLLREVPRPDEAAAPSPLLERTAADRALAALHALPGGLRERTDRVTADVVFLNALLGQRGQLSRRQVLDRAFDAEIEAFARTLPEPLDTLAAEIEGFACSAAGGA